jgi:hypothetical protein
MLLVPATGGIPTLVVKPLTRKTPEASCLPKPNQLNLQFAHQDRVQLH